MNFGELTAADQEKLNSYILKKQEAEVMSSYLTLTQDSFEACVQDFNTSALLPKEEKCISSYVKKFLAVSERINIRFGEENMKLQQSLQ